MSDNTQSRRQFLLRVGALGVVAAVLPKRALAALTRPTALPSGQDDAAWIQAQIDAGVNPIILENRTYTLKRPIVLRNRQPFIMRDNYVTVKGECIFVESGMRTAPYEITRNVFDRGPLFGSGGPITVLTVDV